MRPGQQGANLVSKPSGVGAELLVWGPASLLGEPRLALEPTPFFPHHFVPSLWSERGHGTLGVQRRERHHAG